MASSDICLIVSSAQIPLIAISNFGCNFRARTSLKKLVYVVSSYRLPVLRRNFFYLSKVDMHRSIHVNGSRAALSLACCKPCSSLPQHPLTPARLNVLASKQAGHYFKEHDRVGACAFLSLTCVFNKASFVRKHVPGIA